MEIRINIVEVASELAHDAMVKEAINANIVLDEDEVYEKDENDDETIYIEVCQRVFDRYYDYYYDRLLKLKR